MTPSQKLADFKPGQKVLLSGAGYWKTAPLYIGAIENSRYLLWPSKEAYESGQLWEVSTAGSHGVN